MTDLTDAGIPHAGATDPGTSSPYDRRMVRRYLGSLPDAEWRPLLREQLGRADGFRLHVPDGDGPLSYGREEFAALPGVEVRAWDGMRDALEIAGPLTSAARDLFVRLAPSIACFDPERTLWDYELVRQGTVVLSVGDYHDLVVDLAD